MDRLTKGVHYYTPEAYEKDQKYLVIFRKLSTKELLILDTLSSAFIPIRTLEFSINKIENSSGKNVSVSELPYTVVEDIATHIINTSIITPKDAIKLETSAKLYFDSTFQTQTWSCEVCRAKKLDRQRNCGFLDYKNNPQYFNKDLKIFVGGTLFTHCPIYDIDRKILSAAIEAYNIKEMGFLPDDGGWLDQTRFFTFSATLIHNLHIEAQQKELENK